MPQSKMTSLQIATFAKGKYAGVPHILKNLPIHEVALICFDSDKQFESKANLLTSSRSR